MEFDLKKVRSFIHEAFDQYRSAVDLRAIDVSYYPYVNTNHTIRLRKKKVKVRISDTFADAPESVHRSLAFILVAKLLGETAPANHREAYRRYVRSDRYFKIALENKRMRGKKRITSPVGVRFDLEEIFEKLNSRYFAGELEQPQLSWSERPTFRRLGHHDQAHDTIILSRSLDARGVPEFVVEFVLYHEMLHIKHPVQFKNGRRYSHTAAFREDEAQFDLYEEAEDWIERNASKMKKYSKRANKSLID